MNLTAIALYALGVPLAGMVTGSAFNSPQKARRKTLGMPPLPPEPAEAFATVAGALIWPILGAVCYLAMVWPSKKGADLGRAPEA